MGIFFSDRKPRVTKDEWKKKVRNGLFGRGLKEKEINYVEGLFSSDMSESEARQGGIQEGEIDNHIAWLKANPHLHTLNSEQISIVEEELKKRL
jgi:hypothetical protein